MDFYALFKNGDAAEYADGTAIFTAGETGEAMYVVLDGEVALSVGGKEVYRAKRGEVFGEMALIDEQTRSATATAVGPVRLAVVDTRRFDFMSQNTPKFARHIMCILAERLRGMNARST